MPLTNLLIKEEVKEMDEKFVPKINCRFKIREDVDGYIGFFQGKGILTFNELGAFIVNQMKGEKTIEDIKNLVRDRFPEVRDPKKEVDFVIKQLQDSGFS